MYKNTLKLVALVALTASPYSLSLLTQLMPSR